MIKKDNPVLIKDNLNEHPAVIAWSLLNPELPKPEIIEVVRYPTRNHPHVVRLLFANEDDRSVIARGTNLSKAFIEKSVYENLYKFLNRKVLHYYGYVETENNFAWNFIEDAKGIPFSFENTDHQRLAEDWFAELHTAVPKLDCFPKLGVDYYYSCLHSGYDRITANLSNSALSHSDIALLKSILAHFDFLKKHRDKVTMLYEQMPKGFIHGDFKANNIRVRSNGHESMLLVFDWDECGWGLPGIDMHKLNNRNYWLKVRNHWPDITFRDIKQMSNIGKLLRQLVAINWAAKSLVFEWIDKPIGWMKVFDENLAVTIQHIE